MRTARNGLEAASFPTHGCMPHFRLVLFGKSEPRQCAELSRRLDQIKLRPYCDCGLEVFAMSERDQAGCLGSKNAK